MKRELLAWGMVLVLFITLFGGILGYAYWLPYPTTGVTETRLELIQRQYEELSRENEKLRQQLVEQERENHEQNIP